MILRNGYFIKIKFVTTLSSMLYFTFSFIIYLNTIVGSLLAIYAPFVQNISENYF